MNELKECKKCNLFKELNDLNFRQCAYPNGKFYFKSFCRDCERKIAKEYAQEHKEDRREYQKDYSFKNPDYKKIWKLENKDKINENERNRRANDINYKLRKNVSRAISRVIIKNNKSILKYLSYTVQELREHLEKQFDDKMSWDNYGNYWHIDHITPHSEFKYLSMEDSLFLDCWSLNNLRPLEGKQNMLDGATRIRHKKT